MNCPICDGSGLATRFGEGAGVITETCPKCAGVGWVTYKAPKVEPKPAPRYDNYDTGDLWDYLVIERNDDEKTI